MTRMDQPEERSKKIPVIFYVFAGMGFIPAFGVPFALVSFIAGFLNLGRGRKLVGILGCVALLLNVASYGALFYTAFVKHGGEFSKMQSKLAESQLTQLVKSIEYYKLQKGSYPQSLDELKTTLDKYAQSSLIDMSQMYFSTTKLPQPYFYQLDGDHYYLLSVGPDGKPFTSDDIVPQISEEERVKTGLLIDPASLPQQPSPASNIPQVASPTP